MQDRNARTLIPVLLCIGGLSLTGIVGADAIYKSVDEEGNVTYSETPPGDTARTESVDLPPPPTEAQQREAQKIERRIQGTSKRLVNSLQQERKASSGRVEAARAQVQAAQASLEQAKIKNDSDWQYLAQGGRTLKESYFQRVESAETNLEQAREELAKALRDAN